LFILKTSFWIFPFYACEEKKSDVAIFGDPGK